ncbi:MAG: hypothetical protein P8L37_05815, partial [Phycisphaerales bacterium]|nr:hypothetical protein [Phycisphaerales bacterium]
MSRKMLADIQPKQPRPPKKRKTVAGDRWAILNEFVDKRMAGLTRGEVAVWMVLYRDTRGGMSRTGTTDIARRAGMSVRHAHRAVLSLIDKGLLR